MISDSAQESSAQRTSGPRHALAERGSNSLRSLPWRTIFDGTFPRHSKFPSLWMGVATFRNPISERGGHFSPFLVDAQARDRRPGTDLHHTTPEDETLSFHTPDVRVRPGSCSSSPPPTLLHYMRPGSPFPFKPVSRLHESPLVLSRVVRCVLSAKPRSTIRQLLSGAMTLLLVKIKPQLY